MFVFGTFFILSDFFLKNLQLNVIFFYYKNFTREAFRKLKITLHIYATHHQHHKNQHTLNNKIKKSILKRYIYLYMIHKKGAYT